MTTPNEKVELKNCVKQLVVDEVSLLSGAEIEALNKHLNWLMRKHSHVNREIDIVFVGDFCQLAPIGKKQYKHQP